MCKALLSPEEVTPGNRKLAFELHQRKLLVWNMTDAAGTPMEINEVVRGIVVGVIASKQLELTESKGECRPKAFDYDMKRQELRRTK